MDLNTITCSASMEELSAAGEVMKKAYHRNITFTLARNEFRDVILCISFSAKKETRHILRDITVHKKFVKDGKATIKLIGDKLQFMISNCAPDKLVMFLKTMSTKLECLRKKGFVPDRLKWKSELPKMFQEISPLTLRDLKEANEAKAKAVEKSDMFTPKGKRKRAEGDEKENQPPKGVKMARKLLGVSGLVDTKSPSKIVLSNPVSLNKGQMKVLEAVKSGKNVFFTGSAGTGKSFLLRRIIGALPPQHTFATASTGVAACHIGGTTLHAFAGIGSGKAPIENCVELASRTQVAQQWKKCQHLIIDEISMVDGEFFDKLETVARVIRQKDEPFGGIQLIVCGDFLQLPPVTKGEEKRKFCFQSKAWNRCVQVNLELTDVRRQSDPKFIDVLQNIRLGRCPEHVYSTLRATAQHNIQKDGILATRLCTHKEDVDQINDYHLKKLQGLVDTKSPSKIVLSNPVSLNKGQMKVLEAVKSGKNVFFTGSAGTGKSFLLRRIIGALPPQHTFATASTGVAACHIGGTTLHAFAGIGSGKAPIENCVELASRTQVAQQWKKCQHLIIDEISMVDGEFFDKLETVARVIRQKDEPFGGIQLIVCGDFLQLPPVTKGEEKRKFCFQSKAWNRCVQVNLELTDVRRQSDPKFIDVLQNIRLGRCPEHVYSTLRATAQHNIQKDGILATRLCTHKEDVDQINDYHLKKLQGVQKVYHATDSEEAYLKQINTLAPVPAKLELRIGAQVMLAKNVNVQSGLVNGARGVVVGFEKGNEGLPIVKFVCGQEVTVKTVRWTFKVTGGLYLTRKQVPLKLAWAISIHKSQGMTLDCVEISLSKVFESGQSYVALSRAKNLQGLRVLDFDKKCVRSDPEVLKFYHKLQLNQKLMQSSIEVFGMKRPKHW